MIDFHTHINKGKRSAESVRSHLDTHGGGVSVVLPIDPGPSSSALDEAMSNEETIASAESYPNDIVAFCHVDPTHPDAKQRLKSIQKTGIVRGFGEHKVSLPVDHPRNMEIYELCGQFGWPVLIHMDYTGVYGSNFVALKKVVQSLPDTIFIGHAMAWWTNISSSAITDPASPQFSDYPFGPVLPGGLTDQLLTEYPNVYGDLSARSGYYALSRDETFGEDFVTRHRKKLLWGTDCPCLDGRGTFPDGTFRECLSYFMLPLLQKFCESLGHYNDITHNNAARLLRLPTI